MNKYLCVICEIVNYNSSFANYDKYDEELKEIMIATAVNTVEDFDRNKNNSLMWVYSLATNNMVSFVFNSDKHFGINSLINSIVTINYNRLYSDTDDIKRINNNIFFKSNEIIVDKEELKTFFTFEENNRSKYAKNGCSICKENGIYIIDERGIDYANF